MKKLFILLILLCPLASAYDLTFALKDFNTKAPLAGVNISIYHNDVIPPNRHFYLITDSNGLAWETGDDGEHWYNFTKIGYYSLINGFVNVTADTNVIYYMTPISEDGIIRIRFNDLTLGNKREFCVFYSENNRLEGCYKMNETVQLLVNKAYVIKPLKDKTDILASPSTFSSFMDRYSGYLFPIIFIAVIFIIFIMVVSYAWHKK